MFEPALLDYLNYVEREEALARAGGDGLVVEPGVVKVGGGSGSRDPYQLQGIQNHDFLILHHI